MKTDVLIVGGGPAGLATAIALRRRGASVMVADARKPPIDKACGEGLMPDSLRDLGTLGIEVTSTDGASFRGIRFVNHGKESDVATALFPSGENAGAGIGVRRQTLHARMVTRAEEAGVDLRWLTPVRLESSGKVKLAGNAVGYEWLVGADGQGSQVRRWAGLEQGTILSRRFGFRQHFGVAPWSSFVEVHWGVRGQAYVTPTGPDEVCVAAIVRDPHCKLQTLLAEIPRLRGKLGGSSTNGSSPGSSPLDLERGALTTTRRLHRVARGRVALVGDASGSVDAITGEGIGIAFREGLLLAECLESGDLARYNRLHPAILRLPRTMTRAMLWMDRSAMLRDRAIRLLVSQPTLFERMLGVHLGEESICKFLAADGLPMAWKLTMQ